MSLCLKPLWWFFIVLVLTNATYSPPSTYCSKTKVSKLLCPSDQSRGTDGSMQLQLGCQGWSAIAWNIGPTSPCCPRWRVLWFGIPCLEIQPESRCKDVVDSGELHVFDDVDGKAVGCSQHNRPAIKKVWHCDNCWHNHFLMYCLLCPAYGCRQPPIFSH